MNSEMAYSLANKAPSTAWLPGEGGGGGKAKHLKGGDARRKF